MTATTEPADLFPTTAPSRRGSWVRLVVGLAVLVALVVAAAFYPFGGPGCGFRLVTGFPCPGCGMTRSMIHVAKGDLGASFAFHPLGIPLALGSLAVLAGSAWGALTGTDPVWAWVRRHPLLLVWGAVVLLFGVWALRTFIVPEWASDPIRPPFHVPPK